MRFIITGGTGLIGRALTSSLAADGHEVIILGRNPARATGLPAGVRIEGWDGCTATGWGNLVEGTDGIINLASENIAGDSWLSIRWSKERKKRILDSRINAGNAVSEAPGLHGKNRRFSSNHLLLVIMELRMLILNLLRIPLMGATICPRFVNFGSLQTRKWKHWESAGLFYEQGWFLAPKEVLYLVKCYLSRCLLAGQSETAGNGYPGSILLM